MQVRLFPVGSQEYESALALRYRVLRKPLGVEWTDEERGWELKEKHFGMWEDGKLVACLVVRPLGEGRAKIRQMAVEPELQGTGYGRRLLEGVEDWLGSEGIRRIELNARDVAVGFYEKLGYRRVGEGFTEVGIPHRRMEKGTA